MKKEITYGGIGLLVGLLVAGGAATIAVNTDNRPLMQAMGISSERVKNTQAGHMGMSMDDMQAALKHKQGDEFDKDFTAMMIAHHQGAINMAKYAQQNAKHTEIKKMADDIITAQSKEVRMMEAWRAQWGYTPTAHGHDNHEQD